MRNNWWIHKNMLTPEWCDAVVQLGKEQQLTEAGIFSSNETSGIRNTKIAWIDNEDVNDVCWKIISRANREFFNVHITELPALQYGEYSEGCYYNWHHDVDFIRDHWQDRKLSICIQLSDPSEYEGGKFSFQDYYPPDFSEKGDVLVFPSYHHHRVSKINKGTRLSLVGWAEGPQWR